MKLAHDEGRALVVAINKWDLMEPPTGEVNRMTPLKKEFLRQFHNEIPEINYASVCFTSAKEETGLKKVLDHVLVAVNSWNLRIGTGALNRIIQDAMFERPYTTKGRPFKVYYATQVSTRPPTIVLFCNDPNLLHFSYKRYLENRLRKEYPLPGTSIRIIPRPRSEKDFE
jgi:GTP-binding protein